MGLCECNCGETLTGKQRRFRNDSHRARYWKNCRHAGALGKGLDSLLPSADNKGKAHFVAVIGNKRLEPILMALMARKVMTSAELQAITGSMCIATDLSNIRTYCPQVSRAKFLREQNGKKIYEYRWIA